MDESRPNPPDRSPAGPADRGRHPDGPPAIMLTGVGKRYDIVSCFAALTTVVAVDPNPLAPAQYAAQVRASAPPIDHPDYVPALARLCEAHGVGLLLPLTDLDIEKLAHARETSPFALPALVPSTEVARATYDKYEAHLLLERLGLPSPPTVLPNHADLDALDYPVMVKPRQGSGARSIHLAHDPAQARFFVEYVPEPTMVQRAMDGPELSIDCLGDLDGRCLNAIPRTMLESRGGESIKGTVIDDPELVELGRKAMEALAVRGPATIQVFRDPQLGIRITDVNTRFGGAFPAPALAACAGHSYPELIVRMAAGEPVAPHVGDYRAGVTFTRYYWQLELDERLQPTGNDITSGGGPPPPRPPAR
ncbi:MAG TPA: ATP-grasp domain-containing protein [Solirubrobacteraceae bacterium]|jgi:carbamoyl-phosphate synthase large subunit|nr:ATP-grasp domain-containing protein [Solirubrobacteraceae bacterium]